VIILAILLLTLTFLKGEHSFPFSFL